MSDQEYLDQACAEVGVLPVKIVSAKGLRWHVENPYPDFYKEILKIERLLHKKTGKPIDLRLDEKKDKNKRFDRNYLRGVESL